MRGSTLALCTMVTFLRRVCASRNASCAMRSVACLLTTATAIARSMLGWNSPEPATMFRSA
ncbi:Uncharacterised protein [Mycobacteroides abscessus subsp. abscessus]|nr:Uncharacterised protein [Mycobacteroides abscessus subsp. abscessus]